MEYTESQLNELLKAVSNSDPDAEYRLGCYYYEKYKQDESLRKHLLKAVFLFGIAHKQGCIKAITMLKQIYDNKE